MEILKVENLRKEYKQGNNKVIALDGVDLQIDRGEFVAV
ncbi:MAG: ABC transporter ATP-binding protein, partial [Anaerococcus sp.]|nr:ABC transporter ATP-binding protein [Anaerococcus sp.]